jgi:DNA-directed RNA polymerase I, II, and III subunit RPABC2
MADEDDYGAEDFGDVADDLENLDEVAGVEGAVAEEDKPTQREVARESRALNFLSIHHPECRLDYVEDVLKKLPLDSYPADNGKDKRHRSVPYLTQFERTKIIGFRAEQLANGNRPFVPVPDHVTDVLDIARLELEAKRLPFIIKRPMPDGSFEYIRLSDLIVI